jgi:kumamolisin
MSSQQNSAPVPGSERELIQNLFPDAQAVGAADPHEVIEVTMVLRRKPDSPGSVRELVEGMTSRPLGERRPLSREQFAATYGASQEDLSKIEAFARQHGLVIVRSSLDRRTVELAGTVEAMSAAFGVELTRYETPYGTFRTRSGPVYVPRELRDVVQAVVGLDNRPQVKPHFRLRQDPPGLALPFAAGVSYTPLQIAKLYDFPAGADGSGQCIGILEFGGGYRTADLTTYFNQLDIPVPQIVSVSIDKAQNQPTGNPNGPDGEVMLDIEVAGAVAPKARLVVYFAPNTAKGFVDAVTTAIHDTTNRPSVISISWGGPEVLAWSQQTMQAMDAAFQSGAAMGVTIFCAAGDSGSSDGVRRGVHVDFPASSPNVVGCGGTQLEASGGTISSEDVWNAPGHGATGGGVSIVFARPTWQNGANVPPPSPPGHGGRGVPDVAGDASPLTGYQILVDGQRAVIGGTSAVAPLWAGLTALLNQQLGRPVGFLNPAVYSLPANAGAFHDITSGNNGAYQALQGWDPCTGLGSPDGAKLLHALGGA